MNQIFCLGMWWLIGAVGVVFLSGASAKDILIADFEGKDYGEWNVGGTAFGTAPASGTLPKQRKVSGFMGNGLVNSYLQQDSATGFLTSPPFRVEQDYINFLIGGGGFAGKTCMNLLVGDEVVRTAVGQNVSEGGSEALVWKNWNVEDLKGKKAVLQIVDQRTEGWGHINVDHILQSDTPRESELEPPGFPPSIVPQYPFAETLAEQEAQLADNPLLQRFDESRALRLKDRHYPRYHFCSPEGRLNDPNGLCFWQGNWHLFYQGYPPEDTRQHWGHAVSSDLIHWRDLPYAIYPGPEDRCFSGAAFVEDNRVIAIYHGVGVGTMAAVSADPLLLNWEKLTGAAVIPEQQPGQAPLPYAVFDPCVWKKGDYYYALTGGQRPRGPEGKLCRAEFLHRSANLTDWEYLHPFLENDLYGAVGDDGACPYFWPIGNKHILLHFSHKTGGKYLIGDYDMDRDKFVVTHGGDFNHGPRDPSAIHAPSAAPDGQGGVITIFNMNEGLSHATKWNRIMTLPMRLTLAEDDELDPLRMEPVGDYESLRGDHQHVENIALPANQDVVLDMISGNAVEMVVEIDCGSSRMVELNVLRSKNEEEVTRIQFFPERGYPYREFSGARSNQKNSVLSLDTSRSSILPGAKSRPAETCTFYKVREDLLTLHIFIDRSVVEVFANDRQYAGVRVYPGRKDSVGVSLRSQGGTASLKSLDCWQMNSIYR